MEIYPGLACIWTKSDPSGLSFYIEVHKLPILHTPGCVPVWHSTDQSLMLAGGKVCVCRVFLVMTVETHFLGSSGC